MEYSLDKCIKAIVKHVKLTTSQNMSLNSQNISLNSQIVIRNIQLDDLGIAEDEGIDKQMKDKQLRNTTVRSGKFSRQLNSKNKITAVSTLAVPALVYNFGIVNWLRK